MLENGADLHVNERQKIRHYRARSTEERRRIRKKKNAKSRFFTSRSEYVNLRYIAMLYTHSITYTSPETPTCEVPSNGVVEINLLPVCTGETSI